MLAARSQPAAVAWCIDACVVLLLSAAAFVVSWRAFGAADSAALAATLGAGLGASILVTVVYGALFPGGGSLGRVIAGVRLVRLRDGAAPGRLRAGWVMLLLTLLAPVGLALDTAGMGAGDGPSFHILIDARGTQQLRHGFVGPTT